MLVLCHRALSLNKSNEQGWNGGSVFISGLHIKLESWKFLLSASLSSGFYPLPWIPA